MKYSFKDDYSEGCHPKILQKLMETNDVQTIEGNYGNDRYSRQAKEKIQMHLKNLKAEIHFVSGGTQANLTIISSVLKPWEAVISAASGHIEVHETGAIEATGHKILTVPSQDGKLTPENIQSVLDNHLDEHQVMPKMVYISNATEVGTVYTKPELEDLSAFCKEKQLYLFMDGARLATALTSEVSGLTLTDISVLTDVFYIGGTKNGALLGEAIVINKPELQENFRFAIKQKGALLAKGRLLGIQFLELFEEDLFFRLGLHANLQAGKLSDGIENMGFCLINPTASNQVFPVLPKKITQELQKDYSFHIWEKYDEEKDVIRLVTSWATQDENIDEFLNDLRNLIR